jgi:hypothetical protein
MAPYHGVSRREFLWNVGTRNVSLLGRRFLGA